ncbi:LytR/AlgR family response regulator transcription factor [Spirosoma lituiforme]|nr:MAG: response regulator transcription factor [Pedobacter sp.]
MNIVPKIKCLIVENEPSAQELMLDFVESTPSLTLVGVASNAQEANQLCVTKKPDLLLLDVQMPRFSGFDLLEMLPKPVPLVIITTAYKKYEYAIKGIKFAVVDYLTKPFDYKEFSDAVQKVELQLGVKRSDFETGIQESHIEKSSRILTVKVDRVDKDIPIESIIYLESADNYVKIHLLNAAKNSLITKVTMKELASLLGNTEFVQINRSYVVKINQVKKVTSTSVRLASGHDLPIGSSYKSYIKDFFAYLTSSI